MRLVFALSALGIIAAPTVLAATHNVDVGESGLTFDPSSLHAKVGDIVNFHFYSGDHSVAQSTFQSPCHPHQPKAIFSGFVNPSGGDKEADKMFSMRVNTTEPIFLYCSQEGHCPAGMVMVINPTKKESFDAFQMAARKSEGDSSPVKVFGGVLKPNKDSDDDEDDDGDQVTTTSAGWARRAMATWAA